MASYQIGPQRIMPAKVRAGLEFLSYCLSVEQGCGRVHMARDLDAGEARTKRAVLSCFDQYFLGETDLADVIHVLHEMPPELADQSITEVGASEDCEQIVMDDGEFE